MAKTKITKQRRKAQVPGEDMANCNAPCKETPEQLYAAAIKLVEQSQPEEGLAKAKQLWAQVRHGSASQALPALNLLGQVSVECGDAQAAREYFEQAVALDPEGSIPETMGGGAEKFLWLAQLCEEGGEASVRWFERGAKALQIEIAALKNGAVAGLEEDEVMMLRVEKKRKLANALCGIVEVYMTDLSWEQDAEVRCENLITQAMAVEDETSAEVLQTLASVRLSQERKEDAQSALRRSLHTWAALEPEDPAVPDFATRISLSRLLMEAELESEAMDVLDRLIREDDQSVEAWYLGGWCQRLIAARLKSATTSNGTSAAAMSADGQAPTKLINGHDADSAETIMRGSRSWLKMSLKLYAQLDYEDERLYEHAEELVAELDTALGPENEEAEGGDEEWEEPWDGIAEAVDEDEDMQDS